MGSPDRDLARLAARQHGVFSRRQAVELGFTRSAIQHRRLADRWIEIAPGVHLIAGAPITWHTRLLATCLSLNGVASHRSAAVLHGVDGFRPGVPEVTIARGTNRVRPGVRIHESLDLHRITPVSIAAIPTTPPARLAVDLGAVVSFTRFSRAMDDLLIRRLLTWDDALDALVDHARRGRNGVGALRALLHERYGEVVTDSILEQTFLRGFAPRGLVEPTAQVEIFDDRGFIARVDFAHIDEMVAMELDGRRHHGTDEAFELDPEKRNRLTSAGWQVLVYTWRRLIDRPNGVYAEVERTRTAAAARGSDRSPLVRVRDGSRSTWPVAS